jgi:hypothetical protein
MVAAFANHDTVFTVLGSAARGRSRRSLAAQGVACLAVAAALMVTTAQWWSLSAIALAGALHAGWGLVVRLLAGRQPESVRVLRHAPLLLAAAATGLAVLGVTGLAITLFTGQGRSPYDPCGPHATSAYCHALQQPTPASRIP